MDRDKEKAKPQCLEWWSTAIARRVGERLLRQETDLVLFLHTYYCGTAFLHAYAYSLCAVARIWPDFVLRPFRRGQVLAFAELSSEWSSSDVHIRFEKWFDENRIRVMTAAIPALGFTIEQVVGNK